MRKGGLFSLTKMLVVAVVIAVFTASPVFCIDKVTIKRGNKSQSEHGKPWAICANHGTAPVTKRKKWFKANATFIDGSQEPTEDVTWTFAFSGGNESSSEGVQIYYEGEYHKLPFTTDPAVHGSPGNVQFAICPAGPTGMVDHSFKPGKENLTVTVTNADNPDDSESDTDEVNIVALKLDTAPEYAPEEECVEGEDKQKYAADFEIEAGDNLTLRAVKGLMGKEISWSGNGVQGSSGKSKNLKYTSTGTKKIHVSYGDVNMENRIYVNNNDGDEAAIHAVKPGVDKKWAHCGDETIHLTASSNAHDHDYVDGELDTETNRIDLEATTWKAPRGLGYCDPDEGRETDWTPPSGNDPVRKRWQAPITVGYNDRADPYSPRDDAEEKTEITVGCFITKVKVQITGDYGPVSTMVSENGCVTGNGTVEVEEKGFVLKAEADGGPWYIADGMDDHTPDPITKSASLSWQFFTEPDNAVPDGTIEATLHVDGGIVRSGCIRTIVTDSDRDDGSSSVSLSVGASGYGIGASLGSTIEWGSDESEGAAVVGAGFASEASVLGQSCPNTYGLEEKSSTYAESELPGMKTVDPVFHHQNTSTLTRKPDKIIKARFDLYAKAEAWSNWGEAKATAAIGTMNFSAGVSDVGYTSDE